MLILNNASKILDPMVDSGKLCYQCYSSKAGTIRDGVKICHECELERLETELRKNR